MGELIEKKMQGLSKEDVNTVEMFDEALQWNNDNLIKITHCERMVILNILVEILKENDIKGYLLRKYNEDIKTS